MNGEIKQICEIVISARKSLYSCEPIEFEPDELRYSVRFVFGPRFFLRKTVCSVKEWFRYCRKWGIEDIQFWAPVEVKELHLLGFANTAQSCILCYWNNGTVSCFVPNWVPDRTAGRWIVEYTEVPPNAPLEKFHYIERSGELKQILLEISAFAEEIDAPWFAERYRSAYEILCESVPVAHEQIPAGLPAEMTALFYAVYLADLFGAMGSWNDSPKWNAENNGRLAEYHAYSAVLLKQLRLNLLYVINECWRRT